MDTRVSHCLRAEMRLCLKNEEVEYADLRTPPNPLSYCLYFILFSCRAAFSLIQLHGGKKMSPTKLFEFASPLFKISN